MQKVRLKAGARGDISARKLNAFINAATGAEEHVKHGPLQDFKIAVKDNICTKDLPTTCGSRGLHEYRSSYDATVVARIRDAGGVIVGKTNLDEFGMGSHSIHSAFGPVQGVFDSFSAGGSSGGSAVAVATGECDGALGTDTGGSVRLPAAFNGIFGFKPSYGVVSRWGVVAYANSLDTVGFLASQVSGIRAMFEQLNGFDSKDPTSLPEAARVKLLQLNERRRPDAPLRFGVPAEYSIEEMSPIVRQAWSRTLSHLQSRGHTIQPVSLPHTREALSAYYILAPAEASSNLAKYDGVRYGSPASPDIDPSDLLYALTRQQGFGEEVRRRILLGAYSLSAQAIDNYFIKAQKVRRLVQQDFDNAFLMPNILRIEGEVDGGTNPADSENRVDAFICPTAPDLPPTREVIEGQSPLDAYAGDVFTVPASLAGLPALNFPVQIDPPSASDYDGPDTIGMQVITQYGDDDLALNIGSLCESLG